MRAHPLAAAAALACVSLGGAAHAQMPVIDSANLANTAQGVITAGKQLEQLKSQLTQLQNTYTMFTNPSNVTSMMPGLNMPFVQNSMPAANTIAGSVVGQPGTLTSFGQTYYGSNHVYTATGNDPQAVYLNRSAISTANIQGMASANLASIEQRQSNLNAMQDELTNATDIKQVEAINGRIAIEANAIAGQQAQAQNLQALAAAQAQADMQSQLQAIRQNHEQAAAAFDTSVR